MVLVTNRKSQVSIWSVSLSMTISDLERQVRRGPTSPAYLYICSYHLTNNTAVLQVGLCREWNVFRMPHSSQVLPNFWDPLHVDIIWCRTIKLAWWANFSALPILGDPTTDAHIVWHRPNEHRKLTNLDVFQVTFIGSIISSLGSGASGAKIFLDPNTYACYIHLT